MKQRKAKNEKRKTAETRLPSLPFFVFRFSLFVLPLSLLGSGCAALGVAAYKISGPPSVPAKYTPPKTPLLILVEDYRNESSVHEQADLLSQHLVQEIDAHEIAPVVPLDKLQDLRDARRTDFRDLSITAVGEAVGAKQVLYVQLQSSDVNPISGGEGFSGQTIARVKIVDVPSGRTAWPPDMTEGHLVGATAAIGSSNGRNPMAVRQGMYTQLADQVAKLFYKWKPDDMKPEGFSQ
jgi:hypothetical protein